MGDFKTVTFKYKGDNDIIEMLEHIQKTAAIGHSFEIVVDPDNSDYKKKYYIDGDGCDRIEDIEVQEPKENLTEQIKNIKKFF